MRGENNPEGYLRLDVEPESAEVFVTRRDERPETRAAAAPKTFYVIPRCYAGTSRPRAEQLPAGCRLDNLQTIPPVVAPQ